MESWRSTQEILAKCHSFNQFSKAAKEPSMHVCVAQAPAGKVKDQHHDSH
jgi:hypothetical protein